MCSDDYDDPEEAIAIIDICSSAGTKLAEHKQLTNRETFAVALFVDSAYKMLRDELPADPKSLALLKDYMFTYNKLQPILSPILDM